MDLKNIMLIIVIIVLLYFVIKFIFTNTNTLSNLSSGTTMQTITAATMPDSTSTNFTYSMWFFINDWSYKYGETKILMGRCKTISSSSSASALTISSITNLDPCPAVILGSIANDLSILLAVVPGTDPTSTLTSLDASSNDGTIIHTCSVSNIPIQKWVNLLISTYGRTLDVYLDGKLVNTCVLPGIAVINPTSNVYITPAGGFNGWTAKFQYFPNSTDPQTAWNIYQTGYGANMFSNLIGNYQKQVVFTDNGQQTGQFTI